MQLLSIKEQKAIVEVVNYLVETQQKSTTVADVMARFHLTAEEYRMCSNFAVPALAQGNVGSRYRMMLRFNRGICRDIAALYDVVKAEDGPAAEGVRRLYKSWVNRQEYVEMEDGERGEAREP